MRASGPWPMRSGAAGVPLNRTMVRRAGELERAGEDPAGAAREPKAPAARLDYVKPATITTLNRILPEDCIVHREITIGGRRSESDDVQWARVDLVTGHRDTWLLSGSDDPDWRREVLWVCPAAVRGVRGIEADWARRIAEELDREPDDPRYVRLAVVGRGVDMTPDAVQRLLGHERLVALAWPRREHAPVRTILMFGAPDPEDEDRIGFEAVDLDERR